MANYGAKGAMTTGKGNTSPENHVHRLAVEIRELSKSYHHVARLNKGHPNKVAAYNKLKAAVANYIEIVSNAISSNKLQHDPNGLLNLQPSEKSTLGPYVDEIFFNIKETAMSNRTQIESLFTTDEQTIKGLDSPFLVQKENATIPNDLTPPEKNKVIVRMEELMNEALALVKNPASRNTTEEVAKTWMHREVRRYINFVAKHKSGVDSLGLIYGTYEVPELVQVAKGIVESLGTNSSGGHEADKTMQSLTAGVGMMAQNGDTGMLDSITIGLKKGWGWTWNFIKGTFSYLVGGTVKLVKTIISIIGFTFAQLVSFLDAATTKDFGRSGNPGIISSAMNY